MAIERVVDAHVHVACPPSRAPRNPRSIGSSSWWETAGSVDDLTNAMRGSGVERAVIVQPIALYGYDCRCAHAVARKLGDAFAFVGAIDLLQGDPLAALDQLAHMGDLSGVRLFGVTGEKQKWLRDGRGAAIFGWAATHACSLVATLFARDLDALGTLAASHPTVTVALDHCGFPDIAADEGPLLALAPIPSITLKVTSHNLGRPDGGADFVERLASAFGTDRLCWGSDYPQHMARTYAECLELAVEATRSFSDVDRDRFFASTAQRIWFA